MSVVQTEAEADAQQSAYCGKQGGEQAALERKGGNIRDCKRDGLGAHKNRYKIRRERRDNTREQTSIVNHSDADNAERENGGGYRGSEQRRKDGAHAAHRHDMHILFVKAGDFAYQPRNTAAELKSRALTPGGAAEEVGYDG